MPIKVLVCGDGNAWIDRLRKEPQTADRRALVFTEHRDSDLEVWTSTGAAPDAAIVRVDAREGLTPHSRRSLFLLSLIGVRQIVAAIEFADGIDRAEPTFRRISDECRAYAEKIRLTNIHCFPLFNNADMSWYRGPSLRSCLDTLTADADLTPGSDTPAGIGDQFEATIIWSSNEPMLPSRGYRLQIGAQTVTATLATPKYKLGFEHLEHLAARRLNRGEIGVCNLSLDQAVAFDPYTENRRTGRFALLDRISGEPVGAGFLHFALRRADNIHWQAVEVNQQARVALKGQHARCFWFTGLSASGKSTIANLFDKRLYAAGRHTYLLDGDNVRHGLNRDLGFTEADRVENIRRIAEVARLMVDAGLIVLVSFISPFRAERRFARSLFRPGEFVEVYVDTPLEVCERRDPKGLYKKARAGALKNFTGLDSPYEPPENPEVWIKTTEYSAPEAAERLAEQAMKDA